MSPGCGAIHPELLKHLRKLVDKQFYIFATLPGR
jgi:hypothetical protein